MAAEMSEEKRRLIGWPERRPRSLGQINLAEGIVFLNAENLEVLKGYKAIVIRRLGVRDFQEIHVVLTGLSRSAAERLFGDLKKMDPKEVRGK